ncbi:regulatory protein GemA [Azospirillum sp. RWY-5-1]|uniref:Regulatory protein GemA n=1 Tax=Azospirillum oleiclasticum TaxID=2735135 RepID=A0ABX2TAJ1_9PROT|nr:regulatory protein GemA [Azospirillum oleiclasticum]NYZ12869.1 regulatory protein GemA [Azospirillum oleiclasticum]NYZ20029.1 regulatory protein GemA [Azospirillum oleiclasticum]
MTTSVKPSGAKKPADPLAKLRAKVQTLRRQVPTLADDAVWRPFLALHAGGIDSTRAMSEPQLKAVVRALHDAGAPKRPGRAGGKRQRYADSPQYSKARVLWIALADAGKVRDRSDAALAAFVARQTRQDIGRLTPERWAMVIEALKDWAARADVHMEVAP